jgi:hypothetical protein
MGFVFLSLAAFRRQSKALAYGGVAVGVGLGALLSAARIVQGAHFLSDTIWAFGIVGMVATALILYWPGEATRATKGDTQRMSPRRRIWITMGTAVAVAIIAAGFMTRRPFYKTTIYPLDLSSPIETIRIRINTDPERVDVKYAQEPDGRLKVDAHGFGWMGFDYEMGHGTQMKGTTLNINLHIVARSYFAELDHALTVILPVAVKDRVKVRVNE